MQAELATTPAIRTHSLPGDVERLGELHRRLYVERYGLGESFVADVERAAVAAIERGWPGEREGAWLLENAPGEPLRGAVALLDEGDGSAGTIRWVCLEPELRGLGLGRRLITEAVTTAREAGYERLVLGTFSDLRSAASIYRSLGFEVVFEETAPRWGRADLTFQRYELHL